MLSKSVNFSATMQRRVSKLFWYMAKNYCTESTMSKNLPFGSKVLSVGESVSVERKISEADVLKFAELTNDYNPIHIDPVARIVHGALLNGLLSGVLGTKLPGPGTIVIEQMIRYPKPCYVDDTVQINVAILSVRKIVECKYSIIANTERIVLEGTGRFVMSKLNSK